MGKSTGSTRAAENAAAIKVGEGILQFSWMDNSGNGTAKRTDKVILVAYCPEIKQAVFSLDAGTRDSGSAILDAASFVNMKVATWMSFINKNGDVADSVFTGMVDV